VERAIALPVRREEAWGVLVDWERQADWMLDADRVEVTSPQREGIGVTLAVRTRLFGIPAFTEPMRVTDWDPPHVLTIRHGGPVAGTGTWTLDPIEGGTRFVWVEDVRLEAPVVGGLAARLYAPVLRLLMGRAMEGLRRYLIAAGPDGTAPSGRV
jgi:carbon monoxide dehydrogenase subunit G